MHNASLKILIGWLVVFAVRMIPFRAPNIDPIIGTLMPFSTRLGYIESFFYAFLAIAMYDVFTSGIGTWTWVTAITYGLIGVGARWYFQNKIPTARHYVGFGIVAVLAYDAITMMIGPVFYAQPFVQAVVGQIPFTIAHLAGTVLFAVLLAPALYRWVAQNEQLELPVLAKRFAR